MNSWRSCGVASIVPKVTREGETLNSRQGQGVTALALFRRRHVVGGTLALGTRWQFTFKLSSRNLHQMIAERGVAWTRTAILRLAHHYMPEFYKHGNKYSQRRAGWPWRCSETCLKARGRWTYLYLAVDKGGRTLDFLLSKRRHRAAAKRFPKKTMKAARHAAGQNVRRFRGFASGRRRVVAISGNDSPRRWNTAPQLLIPLTVSIEIVYRFIRLDWQSSVN